MKYYVIAGERSGDLHASNLLKAIYKKDINAEYRCWGGDMMKAAGGYLVKHYNEMAFMGIMDVILHLRKIFRNLKQCKEDILEYNPDVIILVDYAGFNMRIARFAKKHNFRTFYYISPKVWAWNTSRAWKIKTYVDRLFVILPFEKDFFKKINYDVDYVGNPVVDAVSKYVFNTDFRIKHNLSNKPLIAILPGSRRQEIRKNLKKMIQVISLFPDYTFVIAGVGHLPKELFNIAIEHGIKIVYDETYDLLHESKAALVVSGTATLETALLDVPQLVCYETGLLNFILGKLLLKVKFISLVNLLAEKEVVKEFIKYNFTTTAISNELNKLLHTDAYRSNQIKEYKKIKELLGDANVSEKTACLMVNYLKK